MNDEGTLVPFYRVVLLLIYTSQSKAAFGTEVLHNSNIVFLRIFKFNF